MRRGQTEADAAPTALKISPSLGYKYFAPMALKKVPNIMRDRLRPTNGAVKLWELPTRTGWLPIAPIGTFSMSPAFGLSVNGLFR